MVKWLSCFLILVSISSCKTSVEADYVLDEFPNSISAVVTLVNSQSSETYTKKIPVLTDVNDKRLDNAQYAIIMSEHGAMIFYLSKSFRMKLLDGMGSYYQISKQVSMKIKFMNASGQVKDIMVTDSWVDGTPVSSVGFHKMYIPPKGFITVEPSPVKMNEILVNGYGVFAVLKDAVKQD